MSLVFDDGAILNICREVDGEESNFELSVPLTTDLYFSRADASLIKGAIDMVTGGEQ